MRYNRSAITQLKRQYKSVLSKCVLLNAALFVSVGGPVTDAEAAMPTPTNGDDAAYTWQENAADANTSITASDGENIYYLNIKKDGYTDPEGAQTLNYSWDEENRKLTVTRSGTATSKPTADGEGNYTGNFIGNAVGADRGGAINNAEGIISSIVGDFIGNTALDERGSSASRGTGGAIYNHGTITNITGDFIANQSKGREYWDGGRGGAIHNTNNIGTLTGNFIGNEAVNSNNGGAIYNAGNWTAIVGDFIGNWSGNGGAIYNTGTITDLTGDFISNNSSSGGGIFNYGTMNNITGNFINNGGGGYKYYSSIFNRGTIENLNANFIGNHGSVGSGSDATLFNQGTIKYITGDFIGNKGNVIRNYSDDWNLYYAKVESISGNFVDNGGTVITNSAREAMVELKTISGTFTNNGQGITTSSTNIESITGTFTGNGSDNIYGGGALNIGTGVINLIEADFTGNIAQQAGAIEKYDYYGSGKIISLIGNFTNNQATSGGGGAIAHMEGIIENITGNFIGNTAAGFGGAIYNGNNSKTTITNSLFQNNSALKGGAISNTVSSNGDYPTLTIIDSSFIGNKSEEGAALYQQEYRGSYQCSTCIATTSVIAKDLDVEFTNNNSTGDENGTGYGIYMVNGVFNLNANTGKTITINDAVLSGPVININTDETYNGGTVVFNNLLHQSEWSGASLNLGGGTLKLGHIAADNTDDYNFGTLTLTNKPTIDLQNNSADTTYVNAILGNANLKIDVNVTSEEQSADMLHMSYSGSDTVLTIESLNMIGDANPSEFAVDIMRGYYNNLSGITVNLSDELAAQYSGEPISEDYDRPYEYSNNITFDKTNFTTERWSRITQKQLTISDREINSWTKGIQLKLSSETGEDVHKQDKEGNYSYDVNYDALQVLNQHEGYRTLTAEGATATSYTVGDDLGTTATGSLSVRGTGDGSTLDMNNKSGFTLSNSDTELYFEKLDITNVKDAAGGLINLTGDNSYAYLDNVTVGTTSNAAIMNDQTLYFLGTNVVNTAITDSNGGNDEGTIQIWNGETTLSRTLQKNMTISENATLHIKAGDLGAETVTSSGLVDLLDDENALATSIVGGDIQISGNTTASLDDLLGNITVADTGTLTLGVSDTLDKTIDGSGTTKVNTELTLAAGASVVGKLDANDGLLNMNDGEINDYAIGTLKGTGNLALDVDLTQNKADTLTTGASETGTFTITDLNINGTLDDFTVDVLQGSTSNITLALSEAVSTKYNTTGEWVDKASSEELVQNADWTDTFGSKTWQERTNRELEIIDNTKLAYVQSVEKQNEVTTVGDTLALLNQASQFGVASRNFTTSDATAIYEVTADLGETAAGKLTVQGATDGSNTSTVDLKGKEGFTIDNGATVVLDTVNIIGGKDTSGALINNKAGTATMNNVSVASSENTPITNEATMNLTGTNNIEAGINGVGTTNVTSGTTTFGEVTQAEVNVSDGATLNADATKVDAKLINDGAMNLAGTSNANNITGSGKTSFSDDMVSSGDITQETITIAEGKSFTNNGSVTVTKALKGDVVVNNKTLNLDAANMTLEGEISGTGTTNINGDVTLGDKASFTSGVTNVAENASLDVGTKSVNLGDANINGTVKLEITNMAQDSSDYTGGKINADSLNLGNESKLSLNVAPNLIAKKTSTGALNLINVRGEMAGQFAEMLSNNRYKVTTNDEGKFIITNYASVADIIREAGGTRNNIATGEAWDEMAPSEGTKVSQVQNILNDLSQHDEQGYVKALTDLAPTDSMAYVSITQDTNNLIGEQIAARLEQDGLNSGDMFERQGAWVQMLYNHSKQDSNRQNQGFTGRTSGVAFGMDGMVDERTTIGFGYAYGKTDVDSAGRDTDVNGHTIYTYGKYQPAQWYIRGMANYGFAKYKEKAGIAGIANRAKYDVKNYGARAYVGYDLPNGFTPEAGLRLTHIDRETYTDSIGQRVKTNDVDVLTASVGVSYSTTVTTKDQRWTPKAHFALTYDLLSDGTNATVNVADSVYDIKGKRLNRFGAEAGVGAEISVGNWNFSAEYDFNIRKDYISHMGMLKAKYNF